MSHIGDLDLKDLVSSSVPESRKLPALESAGVESVEAISQGGWDPLPESHRPLYRRSLHLSRHGFNPIAIRQAIVAQAPFDGLTADEGYVVAIRVLNAPERETGGVEYLDLEAIKANGIPTIPWIIPGWLAEKDVAMLAGGPGIGKTTTLADLAVALAAGREWCGYMPSRAQRVIWYDEEQDKDTTSRLFIRLGAPHDNLKVASGQGIRLDTPEGVAQLEVEIGEHRPDVAFLDSVQQVFGAVPEKDNTLLGLVYRELFRLRDTYGCTFVLIHHKPKTYAEVHRELIELVRGGTAHATQCSTVWYAAPGKDSNHLNLTQAKRRGAKKQSLQIGYHEDEEDGPITLTGEGAVADAETERDKAEEWIVSHLAVRGVCKKETIVTAGDAEKFSESTIERGLAHLLKIQRLDKPRRGYYCLMGEKADGRLTETEGDGNLTEGDGKA